MSSTTRHPPPHTPLSSHGNIKRNRYRIDKCGAGLKSEFYDNTDNENVATRMEMLSAAMDDVMEYLHHKGEVAILDGTNFTKQRRQLIRDRIAQADGFEILWIESICEDPKVGAWRGGSHARLLVLCSGMGLSILSSDTWLWRRVRLNILRTMKEVVSRNASKVYGFLFFRVLKLWGLMLQHSEVINSTHGLRFMKVSPMQS